jgi:hypothetical protein
VPAEISNIDSFTKIAENAEECRVLRYVDVVKLKLRTPKKLYTMSMEPSKADAFLKNLKCKVVELTKEKKRKSEKEVASNLRETQEEE